MNPSQGRTLTCANLLTPDPCLPAVYQEQPDTAEREGTQMCSTHVGTRSVRTQRTQSYSSPGPTTLKA
jgi:hypothetical protein